MQMLNRRFVFRPVLSIFVVLSLVILVALGNWQIARLAWKNDLMESVEVRQNAQPIPFFEAVRLAPDGKEMEYMPVEVSGVIDSTKGVRVFGTYDAQAGFYFFVPLQPESGKAVFVNLGFVPQGHDDFSGTDLLGTNPTIVTGLFRTTETLSPPASWFQPQGQTGDGLWYARDPLQFAVASGIQTTPFYIDQFDVAGREWPKGGTTRLSFNNRHLEYALTWYGLALTLVGVWLAFSFEKKRTQKP